MSQAATSSAGGRSARRPGLAPVVTYAVTAPTSSQNAAGRAAGENNARHCSHVAYSDWRSNPTPSAACPKHVVDDAQLVDDAALLAPEQRMRVVTGDRRQRHRAALAQLGNKLRRVAIGIGLVAHQPHPDTEAAGGRCTTDDLEQPQRLALERRVGVPDGAGRRRRPPREPVADPLGQLGPQEARRSQHARARSGASRAKRSTANCARRHGGNVSLGGATRALSSAVIRRISYRHPASLRRPRGSAIALAYRTWPTHRSRAALVICGRAHSYVCRC